MKKNETLSEIKNEILARMDALILLMKQINEESRKMHVGHNHENLRNHEKSGQI
jgi:hypothetical protein